MNIDPRKKVSLVVPAYNEQAGIPAVMLSLESLCKQLERFSCEVLIVNDGSTDETRSVVKQYVPTAFELVLVDLSRNFGKEAALSAGLAQSGGDAVIPLDADLQDPPDVILEMIDLWEAGAEVVLARRSDRSSDSWGKRVTALLFYRFFNKMSDVSIPDNVGDFRLMSRNVVDVINDLKENRRFMKGLFAWAGFETKSVEYVRPERFAGKTKFNGFRLVNLAIEGVTSFSTAPLRLVTYAGLGVAILSLLFGGYVVIHTVVAGRDVPGYASIVSMLAFLSGIQLLGLGVIGEYVGRTYIESKQRPPYVIRSVTRFHARSRG